jgi:uncharacterized protein YidB (DUF937 family)
MAGMPSMTALLGLLAVAGYQNRDKIEEALNGFKNNSANPQGQQGGLGGASQLLGRGTSGGGLVSSLTGAGGVGGLLGGGLGGILDSFRNAGHGDISDSWVNTGPNKEVSPPQVKQAIGADVLAELVQKTGLSESEILSRLSQRLPEAVDKYTPDGRLP